MPPTITSVNYTAAANPSVTGGSFNVTSLPSPDYSGMLLDSGWSHYPKPTFPTQIVSGTVTVPNIVLNASRERYMKRLVNVIIVDPDERVPAKDSVLYISPAPYFTDDTDQEIYAGIQLKELLDRHNLDVRALIVDKKRSGEGKTHFLEPIRLRDLKMVVINLATF